jgi:hypothetical protein
MIFLVAADRPYGGSDGEGLDELTAPEARFLDELHADDSWGAEGEASACLRSMASLQAS